MSHKRTLSLIERAIGIMKIRFPCLNKLRVGSPEYAAEFIKACVVLHNLCILIEGALDDEVAMQYVEQQVEEQQLQPVIDGLYNQGRRRQLIEQFD